jgi:hypothetical protein
VRPQNNRKLAAIGFNLADTPEVSSEIVSLVRRLISRGRTPDVALLGGFHWLEDRAILSAMKRFIASHKKEWEARVVVEMIASRPESARAYQMLQGIAADTTYPSSVRSVAATQLRLSGRRRRVSRADMELLFLSDPAAACAEFRRRLREGDAKVRASALKLLGMAPDSVIVGLEDELSRLPEENLRERGKDIVRQAKERIAAVGRFGGR